MLRYKVAAAAMRDVPASAWISAAEAGISPEEFFRSETRSLGAIPGIKTLSSVRSEKRKLALERAGEELKFISRHGVKVLFITDDNYPYRLRECPGAPSVLFMLGEESPHPERCVGIVGTRRATDYGVSTVSNIVDKLAETCSPVSVVSGLAYGIDAAAHLAALRTSMPTVAVVAHGLDTIYPAAHRDLARNILKEGGAIVTEYLSGTPAHRGNFLERNRIVAGLSDALVVVESEIKGGAMSTARYALEYDREVFAIPGRIVDPMSSGCNHLIEKERARICTGAESICKELRWTQEMHSNAVQKNLFDEESPMISFIREKGGSATIDQMCLFLDIPVAELMRMLTELEFDGIIRRLPGNRYILA